MTPTPPAPLTDARPPPAAGGTAPGDTLPVAGVTCPYCTSTCHICAHGGLDGIDMTKDTE